MFYHPLESKLVAAVKPILDKALVAERLNSIVTPGNTDGVIIVRSFWTNPLMQLARLSTLLTRVVDLLCVW